MGPIASMHYKYHITYKQYYTNQTDQRAMDVESWNIRLDKKLST